MPQKPLRCRTQGGTRTPPQVEIRRRACPFGWTSRRAPWGAEMSDSGRRRIPAVVGEICGSMDAARWMGYDLSDEEPRSRSETG
jgi:hypothetical protein